MTVLIIGVAVGLLLAALAALTYAGWSARAESDSDEQETRAEIDTVSAALESGDEVYVATGRPNEFMVYTRDTEAPGDLVPADLARTAAASISATLRAGVEAAKASGRLVMVDGATAKAIREGAMATDKAGKTLAVVRGTGGKWSHVTRLTPAAGKAAGAALGAANVLGAVSTQMQMAAIEAKLSDIVDGVQSLENIARRELDSSIYATRKLVEEVVGASREAGHLPEQSWAMIAPHYKDIIEDQQMARGAVEELVKKARQEPKGFWLKTRAGAVKDNRDLLIERLHTLKEADLNVIRMHVVRLWHYTVVQPQLAGYFEELARTEIEAQSATETRLLEAASSTISQHGELGSVATLFHWSAGDDFRKQIEEFSDFVSLRREPDAAALGAEIDREGSVPK